MEGQTEEKKQGAVTVAIGDLNTAIEAAGMVIDRLVGKLDLVIGDTAKSEDEAPIGNDKSSVGLSREIDLSTMTVKGLTKRLKLLNQNISI